MAVEEVEADLPDSRMRHFLATVWNGSTNNVKGLIQYQTFDFGYKPEEMEQALDLLTAKGYLQRVDYTPPTWNQKLPNTVQLYDKAKEAGKLLRETFDAKQTKHVEGFSKRWTDAETEAFKLLTWAWKQHKGDLNKPVDLRRYAKEARRSKYEVEAAYEWLRQRRYIERDDHSYAINAHCDNYWDVPINTFFPHESRIALTRPGADKAASMIREEQAKWKQSLALIASGIKEAPKFFAGLTIIVGGIIAVSGYLGGYLKGYYDGLRKTPAATQPVTATTNRGQ